MSASHQQFYVHPATASHIAQQIIDDRQLDLVNKTLEESKAGTSPLESKIPSLDDLFGASLPTQDNSEGKLQEKIKNNKAKKYRGFCFTDHMPHGFPFSYKHLKDMYDREDRCVVEYMIFAIETCPTTLKKHLQGFMYFTNPRSFNGVQKDNRHFGFLQQIKGTPLQNKHYCSKGDQPKAEWDLLGIKGPNYGKGLILNQTFFEFGDCPMQGERTDVEVVCKAIADKEIKTELELFQQFPVQAVTMHKGMMRMIRVLRPPRTEFPDVYLLLGPPGTGKSYMAHMAGAKFISICGTPSNPFLLGYDGEDCICFDDFDPHQCTPNWFFKICDRYNYIANVKGDDTPFRASVIYITVNIHPKFWWPSADQDQYLAFERRIKSIIQFEQNPLVAQRKPFKQTAFVDYSGESPQLIVKDLGFVTDEETRLILEFREAQKKKAFASQDLEFPQR